MDPQRINNNISEEDEDIDDDATIPYRLSQGEWHYLVLGDTYDGA